MAACAQLGYNDSGGKLAGRKWWMNELRWLLIEILEIHHWCVKILHQNLLF